MQEQPNRDPSPPQQTIIIKNQGLSCGQLFLILCAIMFLLVVCGIAASMI